MLKFESVTKYKRGIVFSLLAKSWGELWNDKLEANIKKYDDEVFENPDTVGACIFITTLNGKAIGMASWDPRKGPELGQIGWNCILPEYQGQGFGKAQIQEVLKRLKNQGFKKVSVTTGEYPFFNRAQKLYVASGFKEIMRDPKKRSIDYEMELKEDLDSIKLIEPTAELESEFFAMVEEFKAEGDTFINGIGSIDIDNFATSVELAKHHAEGVDLPEGWVACSTYWLVCENRVLGTCNLRHELNDFLEGYGGRIGYSIRPLQRSKGYGTVMLKLALQKAGNLGLKRVLVTCDDNNIASARVIEKNGGILADKVKTQYSENPTRRYWIDLSL